MAKPKIKQVGRGEARDYLQGMSMEDMREACKHAERATILDMVGFVRKRDPSLTLSEASAIAKGVHNYLSETE